MKPKGRSQIDHPLVGSVWIQCDGEAITVEEVIGDHAYYRLRGRRRAIRLDRLRRYERKS